MVNQVAVFAASLAVASAIFAAHSGFTLTPKPRTKLHGPVFDSGHGYRFTWTDTTSAAGETVGVMHVERDAGTEGTLAGKHNGPPLHEHLTQEECFTVHEGVLGYTLNGKDGQLRPADGTVCHPKGVEHTVWNDDLTSKLRLDVAIRPAGNSYDFFRTLEGFSTDEGSMTNVSMLRLLTVFVQGSVKVAAIPAPVWAVIDFLARWVAVPVGLGFPDAYTKH